MKVCPKRDCPLELQLFGVVDDDWDFPALALEGADEGEGGEAPDDAGHGPADDRDPADDGGEELGEAHDGALADMEADVSVLLVHEERDDEEGAEVGEGGEQATALGEALGWGKDGFLGVAVLGVVVSFGVIVLDVFRHKGRLKVNGFSLAEAAALVNEKARTKRYGRAVLLAYHSTARNLAKRTSVLCGRRSTR